MATQRDIVCDDIIFVNHSNTNGIYEVRVLRRWGVHGYSRPAMFSSVDMILIDKHGHKIQPTIPNDALSLFDEQIHEGRVYKMTDFTVSSILVQGVEHVTKILVNPLADEVINVRNGLLLYLGRSPNYGGFNFKGVEY
ncbi:hypothetical protein TSUD_91140 [Trifolium subterraneum]|uniref:Replication protein A 70 kDa DNA-binding subunit B/D first OB fold domain-containing protein n=1 Tax=Trifolium subterraneum TaxID=3900 RepID=A0A2Z6P2P2_TRISU|nr:hypothetical protein TSUD_91140 [Trifolium subterraneum]